MKKFLFVISALVTCQSVLGQHSGKKIIVFINDTTAHRLVIPDSIFSCHADAFKYTLEIGDGKHHYGYDIRWYAPEIDGSYVLSVTDKQLYLRSRHDNPNPSYLYWLTNITPVQYKLINEKIKQHKAAFSKPYNGTMLATFIEYKQAIPENLYGTLKGLITLFNEGLSVGQQILCPERDAFENTDPVQIIISEDEIRELVPPPDDVNTPA